MTSGYSEDVLNLNPELRKISIVPASKYHNVRAEARGLSFQSGHEAAEISKLILLEEQRKIFGLRLQVRFPLAGKTSYIADAVYLDESLEPHVIDCKGFQTKEFKLKAELFKEKYGREIELI